MQIFQPKFGNIFNFCRIFAIYITVLTISRSVIWRSSVWEDGGFLLGKMAKNIHISYKFLQFEIQK